MHQEWVERFALALKNKGVQIWLDVWFIKPGDPYKETLRGWLSESDFVIVIGTPRYGSRAYPGRKELERKIKKRLGSYADTSEEFHNRDMRARPGKPP